MTPAFSSYSEHRIVFATMHGKEKLAVPSFAERLGATVIAPHHLDTDQLGTFAGDIPRTLSPLAAATVKARLGMQITGLPHAMASEGSFTSTPFGEINAEILLFVDERHGLEIVEHSTEFSPAPPGRAISTIGEAVDYASIVDFPRQGLTLQARFDDSLLAFKDIPTLDELVDHVERSLGEGMMLTLMPDHRAHRSPARAAHIRSLCHRMAHRLATPCPTCGSPGYGVVDVEVGLPCSQCDAASGTIAADIHGCGVCGQRDRIPRAATRANPATCSYCNP